MAEIQTTRLGRSWLVKMAIFLTVSLVLGVWGYLDATLWYPKRGLGHASNRLSLFLQAASNARQFTPDQIGMTDPADRYADLSQRKHELEAAKASDNSQGRAAVADLARLEWLEALNRTWVIRHERVPIDIPEPKAGQTGMTATHFDLRRGVGVSLPANAAADATGTDVPLATVLNELREKWGRTESPSPLASYDLYVQWLFAIAGVGCAIWVVIKIIAAAGKRYQWEPATQTLTLPGGKTVTPADLRDIDKRKWHKYFCTLEMNDGTSHSCDLLKYQPLEEWVLEMERTAFPDRAEAEEEADEENSNSPDAQAASAPE